MQMLWLLVAILALLASSSSISAQEDDLRLIFAEPKKDWEWEEDKRFDFLVERLASLEASLEAVDRAIAKASGKRGTKQGLVRRAESNNSMMDRKGGGPMKWNEFYGTTAEKFFYHPTDRNTTYHTNTTLRQMGSSQDDKAGNGVPSSQSVPTHQRPPQFDYIYRANRDAKEKAEQEALALSGQIEELTRRRAQLEDEQAELWCLLAFRAIQRQNMPKKPMLRFALMPTGTSPEDLQKHEALTAATRFLAAALLVIDKAEQDQATALTGLKQVVGPARTAFDDALINLTSLEDDAANKKKKLGQYAALAQLLDDTANNLSESYVAAMDGDRFKDEAKKDRFRGLLQRSLIEYAQILLALDELTNAMRKDWDIKVDTQTPASGMDAKWAAPAVPSPKQSAATPLAPPRADMASLLKQMLHGPYKYDATRGVLTVTYDFHNADQLKDFVQDPGGSATINDNRLTIKPQGTIRHVIDFETAEVTGTLLRKGSNFGKMHFDDPGSSFYGGGSISSTPAEVRGLSKERSLKVQHSKRLPQWWVDLGGLTPEKPSPFTWAMTGQDLTADIAGKRGSVPCSRSPVGRLHMEAAEQGFSLIRLTISGTVSNASASTPSK